MLEQRLVHHRKVPVQRTLYRLKLLPRMACIIYLLEFSTRLIKSYGVFVDIGGFHTLRSVSTISQLPIESPEQVFQIGDWVRAIIVWMDIEKGRVLLSTSDLEPEPGDMLCNPLHVYERAEEMANRYRQNI